MQSATSREREGCGWRNPKGVSNAPLINKAGENGPSQFGELPWICAILRNEPGTNQTKQPILTYIGSGSLIHPGVVLTVAHLFNTPAQLRVRCGEWDSIHDKEPYPYQEINVEEVVVHQNYSRKNLHYDIALLFLSEAMELTPTVGLACLPSPGFQEEAVQRTCFSTGWGKDRFGKEGRYENIIKKIPLLTINHTNCEELLRKTRLGPKFQLHSSFNCAGSTNDGCSADGGAPVACPIEAAEDRYAVYGAFSWSIGCGTAPAVYADVPSVKSWVDTQFMKYEYDSITYTYSPEKDIKV